MFRLTRWHWLTLAWCCLFWAALGLLVRHWWGL